MGVTGLVLDLDLGQPKGQLLGRVVQSPIKLTQEKNRILI